MSNYIKHHGIKGMKWGVRRYQKIDGTLTSAGKQRYNSDAPKWTEKLPTFKEMAEMKKNDPKKYERYKAWEANQDFHKSMENINKKQEAEHQQRMKEAAKEAQKAKTQARMSPERLQGDLNTAKGLYDKYGDELRSMAKNQATKEARAKITYDLSQMTDKELQAVVNRLNNEERYTKVMMDRHVQNGKSFTEKLIDGAGTALVLGTSALALAEQMKKLKAKTEA